jgi:hypothetical protein
MSATEIVSAMLFPSGIRNDTVMIIVKFVIITEFTRSQNIISDGRVVGFRTYILSYIEYYYLNEISLRTTPLF